MTLKGSGFQPSGLGASLQKFKEKKEESESANGNQEKAPEEKAGRRGRKTSENYPPLSKISIRFTQDQITLIENLRDKVEAVANEPRRIHCVTILRALIFLAAAKKTEAVYNSMRMQSKYRPVEDNRPLCIPMTPELRSKLEEQFSEIRKYVRDLKTPEKSHLGSKQINNTLFFRAMLTLAEKEKPQKLYQLARDAVI